MLQAWISAWFQQQALALFVVHGFLLREKTNKNVSHSYFYGNLKFLFIVAEVLNSPHFDSISFCEKFETLWASSAHMFSLVKIASEAQKPLAKMEFLLCC